MTTEIIYRPVSGEYEEKCFNDTGSVIWVKFMTDDLTEWVGAFGLGEYGITKVAEQGQFSFIVAKGQGYLVDRNSKKLIFHEVDYPYVKSVLVTKDPDYILYTTDIVFKAIKDGKIIKEVKPEMVDGIEFLRQENQMVKGQIFEISSNEFWNGMTLDLNTFQWTIDWDVKVDYWGILKQKMKRKNKLALKNIVLKICRTVSPKFFKNKN